MYLRAMHCWQRPFFTQALLAKALLTQALLVKALTQALLAKALTQETSRLLKGGSSPTAQSQPVFESRI